MSAFMDATCPNCGRRVGWLGSAKNRPRCVCGHRPPDAELEASDRKLDELRQKMLADDPPPAAPKKRILNINALCEEVTEANPLKEGDIVYWTPDHRTMQFEGRGPALVVSRDGVMMLRNPQGVELKVFTKVTFWRMLPCSFDPPASVKTANTVTGSNGSGPGTATSSAG